MNLVVGLTLLNITLGLNIILTSTDSWVSSNLRYLYHQLSTNHTVILVGSLYNHQIDYINDISDGGDFNHLLPINQIYYRNIDLINQGDKFHPDRRSHDGPHGGPHGKPRGGPHGDDFPKENHPNFNVDGPMIGAKGVIFNLDSSKSKLVSSNNYFGQDPQNDNIWFINDNPLNSLIKTFDTILPIHYPDFDPDLVIITTNENNYEIPNFNNKMLDYSLSKNVSGLTVAANSVHSYYHDFNKRRGCKWKWRFISWKILQMINLLPKNQLQNQNQNHQSLIRFQNRLDSSNNSAIYPNAIGIKLNLPNFNFFSKCHRVKPSFTQINSTLTFNPWVVPKFSFENDKFQKTNLTYLSRSNNQDFEKSNVTEILDACNISLEIIDNQTNNIPKHQFDLEYKLSLQPDPKFRRYHWRKFFRFRFYKRVFRYLVYKLLKLTNWV